MHSPRAPSPLGSIRLDWHPSVAGFPSLIPFVFVVLVASASAQTSPPSVSGQLTLSPIFSSGSAPTYGLAPQPLDFTSNSRLTVDYGEAKVNVLLVKPTTYVRAGQPEQYYTVEVIGKRQTARIGDLSPRFTDNTTGYGRVHGGEVLLAAGDVATLNLVHGLSQRATPTAGYLIGTYQRRFSGARLALSPVRALSLGVNAVSLRDDPASASLQNVGYAPRAGDNALFGSDLTISFLKRHRASLQLEYAASVLTNDLGASDSLGHIRGERLSPRGFADAGLIRRFAIVNDSTRVGHVLAAKLTLPIKSGRTTVELRRASPLFSTLSMPWNQTGEKLRVQHTSPFFDRAVQVMATGEVSRWDPSRYQTYSVRTLTGYSNVAFTKSPVGRVTVGLRVNRRANDAPAPEAGRFDRRMDASTITPSLAVTRDVRLGVPLALTTTLTGTFYGDRFRPNYDYRTLGLQMQGQTPQESRLQLNAQTRYALTERTSTGSLRTSAEVLLREGYSVHPERLHLFLINGVALERAPEWNQKSALWTYGGGARWTPSEGTGLELEWQSRRMLDLAFSDHDQHNLELRLTHRW